MTRFATLNFTYKAQDALDPPPAHAHLLGGTCFGENIITTPGLDSWPVARVPCAHLTNTSHHCELWSGLEPTQIGQIDGLHYRADPYFLFGVLELDTDSLDKSQKNEHNLLSVLTENAYRKIFTALKTGQYPHLIRVWNYIRDIHQKTDGLEHYRQFNIGRQAAFEAYGYSLRGATVPSASAVGTHTGKALTICFLAGRLPAQAIENPRQISACDYPHLYGPKSPTFSRASFIEMPHQKLLFISGTASIVGHESRHIGHVVHQTEETFTNIQALLTEAQQHHLKAQLTLTQLFYKVYIRNRKDLPAIQSIVKQTVGDAHVLYLQADICREELLVEIEAIGTQINRTLSP